MPRTYRLAGARVAAAEEEAPQQADVVDLVAALRASVEAAKKRREEAAEAGWGARDYRV